MKKLFALIAVLGILSFGVVSNAMAQNESDSTAGTQTTDSTQVTKVETVVAEDVVADEDVDEQSTHQVLKQKFIEGGAGFMALVIICLILGLAISIERIIYLNLATTNTTKLLTKVETALKDGGVEAAKEVCRSTRGPVASIFYQGIDRFDPSDDQSVIHVERAIVAYGGVQEGQLSKGLIWIALAISIAPMLGFMGTVIGMIGAFDAIQAVGDINPTVVAGGIKVALITTVAGLVVAIILQILYNYIVSKVDSITNRMEDASISLVDVLVKYNHNLVKR